MIEFCRRVGVLSVSFMVQFSDDLDGWSGATVPFEVIARGDGTESVFIRSVSPTSAVLK